MTVIYETKKKTPKMVEPRRYEVQWDIFGRWTHWSWHRYKWSARFEMLTSFNEMMRVVDHGK